MSNDNCWLQPRPLWFLSCSRKEYLYLYLFLFACYGCRIAQVGWRLNSFHVCLFLLAFRRTSRQLCMPCRFVARACMYILQNSSDRNQSNQGRIGDRLHGEDMGSWIGLANGMINSELSLVDTVLWWCYIWCYVWDIHRWPSFKFADCCVVVCVIIAIHHCVCTYGIVKYSRRIQSRPNTPFTL